MASLIVYVNQLLNQTNSQHTNNFADLTPQQQHQQQLQNQKINDTNLLAIKSIIQQQQFNQTATDSFLGNSYSCVGNPIETNNQNLFHNSNISNILNKNIGNSTFMNQNSYKAAPVSSSVWNNDFSSSSRFNNGNSFYMGTSQSPPPPAINSAPSSIAMPSNSSASSTPSPHLIHSQSQNYNYFGNNSINANLNSFSMGAKNNTIGNL
jgi:hypothetical protein